MPTAEEVRRLRDEQQIGVQEAAAILRRREKLERLKRIRASASMTHEYSLVDLLDLLIEEGEGT